MRIFSTHRRKLEPSRRFGGRAFQDKVKNAANYKRVFTFNPTKWYHGLGGWFSARGALWRTMAVLAALAVIYFMFFSRSLSVSAITVTDNHAVSAESIEAALRQSGSSRFLLLRKDNFFLMTEGRVNAVLTKNVPEIKHVETSRAWPNKIRIKVTERNPGFVILSAGNYFLVDDEGTVVKPVDAPGNFLVAEDQLLENFAQGETLNTKLAPFVTTMAKLWPAKVSTAIARAKFPGKAGSDVEFATVSGWSVLFSVDRPARDQLDSLVLLLNRQISARDQERLAYIDLRLSKWAYYCLKASPCQSQEQPEAQEEPIPNAN